jgi:hypothetical protein
MGEEKPETRELRIKQEERETAEFEALKESHLDDEKAQHARRADKAAYLREKLEQRAESERKLEEEEE